MACGMMPRFDAPNLHHSAVLFYQLTRPRGARHFVFAPGPILKPFQLTRPRGARRRARRSKPARSQVSTHAPAGGATWSRGMPFSPSKFQLTRPRGARPTRCCILPHGKSFNSRAREGRDVVARHAVLAVKVSTHAPTRGATNTLLHLAARQKFQLTRPRGARLFSSLAPWTYAAFQLTRPRGARHGDTGDAAADTMVSTHAPARDATSQQMSPRMSQRRFNSRAREGRDPSLSSSTISAKSFNSRAREGRDHPRVLCRALRPCFNSRAREGRDFAC